MTSFRTAIPDFQTANPLYVGATVFFYEADASGNKTSTLATLYAGAIGTLTVANPQTLDSDGKFVSPVYIDSAVIGEIVGPTVGSHDTGIIQAFINGNWRGTWTTATLYIRNDFVLSDTGFSIYVASQNFTSSGTLAQDISDGNLVVVIDVDALTKTLEKIYFGPKASDPATDNEGNALSAGDLYFNTSTLRLRVYNGTIWQNASATVLDDLTDVDLTTTAPVTGDGFVFNGTKWVPGPAGGGMFKGNNGTVGSRSGDLFRVNAKTLNTNTTIAGTENASVTGPLTVASGVTLTVASGGTLRIL